MHCCNIHSEVHVGMTVYLFFYASVVVGNTWKSPGICQGLESGFYLFRLIVKHRVQEMGNITCAL